MGRGDNEENNYFLTPFKPDNFTPQNEIFYSGEGGGVRSLVSFLTPQGAPGSHPSTHPLIALSVQCSAVLHPSVMVFFISLADLFYLDFMSGWV